MKIDIGSLNLAIVYGFGLIILALVQAVIYNQYCTRLEEKEEAEDAENEANEENAASIKNECSENTATGGDVK
jgi:flagellar biosynthesis/type III secretory pathway M-ring protein FliF/YscJ